MRLCEIIHEIEGYYIDCVWRITIIGLFTVVVPFTNYKSRYRKRPHIFSFYKHISRLQPPETHYDKVHKTMN